MEGESKEVTVRMSARRRSQNPGRRERQAGKRHRRGLVWQMGQAAVQGPLKVGHRHLGRILSRHLSDANALAVADAENSENGPEEPLRQDVSVLPGVLLKQEGI